MIYSAHDASSWATPHTNSLAPVPTAFGPGDGGRPSGTVGHDTIEQSQAASLGMSSKGDHAGSLAHSASTNNPAPSGANLENASDSLRSLGKDIKSTGSVITGTSASTNSMTATVKPVSSAPHVGDDQNAKDGSIESLRTNLNV